MLGERQILQDIQGFPEEFMKILPVCYIMTSSENVL
jgi:hypothetical protein